MESITILLAVVSLAISTVFQGINTYLQWKKANEPPKDEVWETAKSLVCASGKQIYSDEFAELYFELRFLKEHPEQLAGHNTIGEAMQQYEESKQQGPSN